MTALACIQLQSGLRPDQVALGLPGEPGAAGGGVCRTRRWSTTRWTAWPRGTNCGSFRAAAHASPASGAR